MWYATITSYETKPPSRKEKKLCTKSKKKEKKNCVTIWYFL